PPPLSARREGKLARAGLSAAGIVKTVLRKGESCRVECGTDRRRTPGDQCQGEVRSVQLPGYALGVAGCGAGQKHQSKFADLHLVAVRQHSPVHRFTVDVRAVEAADVDNLEFAAYAPELGMPAADSDVIEEDIAIRVTPGGRGGPVEQDPRAGVRAALDHQQPRALRQRLRTEQLALGAGGGRRVLRVGEVGTKRRGPLPGDVFSPLVIVVIGHPLRRHQRATSLPVKSNASPNSMSMFSDIISPTFLPVTPPGR